MDSDIETRPDFGPGRLLTDARLKLGLEQENVAEMLHLRTHQIRALEADDYDKLPEPTYVKGYLRAYCQLLALNPEQIIDQYTRYASPPVKESYEGLTSEKQAVSSDNLIKMASVGLVTVIAGLAIVYWMTASDKRPSQEMTATPMVDQAPGYAPEYPEGGSVNDSQVPLVNAYPGADNKHPGGNGQEIPNQSVSRPSTATAAKPGAAPQVGGVAPTGGAPTSSGTAPVAKTNPSAPAASAPVTGPTPVQQPATPIAKSSAPTSDVKTDLVERSRSRLLLKTASTSWIDVRDVYDNKLIYETVPAGREIPLEGMAPFKVFLGNAEGVQIFVEGKEFNFSRFKRGQTARFSLNVEESNR